MCETKTLPAKLQLEQTGLMKASPLLWKSGRIHLLLENLMTKVKTETILQKSSVMYLTDCETQPLAKERWRDSYARWISYTLDNTFANIVFGFPYITTFSFNLQTEWNQKRCGFSLFCFWWACYFKLIRSSGWSESLDRLHSAVYILSPAIQPDTALHWNAT